MLPRSNSISLAIPHYLVSGEDFCLHRLLDLKEKCNEGKETADSPGILLSQMSIWGSKVCKKFRIVSLSRKQVSEI